MFTSAHVLCRESRGAPAAQPKSEKSIRHAELAGRSCGTLMSSDRRLEKFAQQRQRQITPIKVRRSPKSPPLLKMTYLPLSSNWPPGSKVTLCPLCVTPIMVSPSIMGSHPNLFIGSTHVRQHMQSQGVDCIFGAKRREVDTF